MKTFILLFFFFLNFKSGSQAIDTAFFGIHNGNFLTQEQRIFFPTMRIWDMGVCWNQLEQRKGKWDFDRFDQIVSKADKGKIELVYTLGQTPNWASSRPDDTTGVYGKGANYVPVSIALWEQYVRKVGERYKGKIRYYEIWNEPNFPIFFNGTVAEMRALTLSASKILKAIDPEIKIISPGIVAGSFDWLPTENNGTAWMTSYLNVMPPRSFDIVGAHFYTAENDVPEKELIPLIRNFKKMLQENHVHKPVWNTEQGYGAMDPARRKNYSGDTATGIAVRTFLINLMEGVERMYWYNWSDRSFCSLYLVEQDGVTPTDAARAIDFTRHWLKGKILVRSELMTGPVHILHFRNEENEKSAIAWSERENILSGPVVEGIKRIHSVRGTSTDFHAVEIKTSILPLFMEY